MPLSYMNLEKVSWCQIAVPEKIVWKTKYIFANRKKGRKMRHISVRKKTKSEKKTKSFRIAKNKFETKTHFGMWRESEKTYTSFRYEQKKSTKITNTHSVSGKNKHISVRKKSK